jgi:hypothetical protein
MSNISSYGTIWGNAFLSRRESVSWGSRTTTLCLVYHAPDEISISLPSSWQIRAEKTYILLYIWMWWLRTGVWQVKVTWSGHVPCWLRTSCAQHKPRLVLASESYFWWENFKCIYACHQIQQYHLSKLHHFKTMPTKLWSAEHGGE